MLPHTLDAALFDLDGTLVDSVADLSTGINLTLADLGFPPLPRERVASFIGDGVVHLVARSIAAASGEPGDEALGLRHLERFRGHYSAHLLDETRLRPGALELLDLVGEVAPVALVTNKPVEPATRILEGLGIHSRMRVVVGGDTLSLRKPHAAPILYALERCGARSSHAVMVGDGPADAGAARAAAVHSLGVRSNTGPGPTPHIWNLFVPDLAAVLDALRPIIVASSPYPGSAGGALTSG